MSLERPQLNTFLWELCTRELCCFAFATFYRSGFATLKFLRAPGLPNLKTYGSGLWDVELCISGLPDFDSGTLQDLRFSGLTDL